MKYQTHNQGFWAAVLFHSHHIFVQLLVVEEVLQADAVAT
jgi:hypothetical protein